MKKLIIIALIALALLAAIPAAAVEDCVWHNGRCMNADDYKEMIRGATVIHNSKTGVDSVHADVNNPNPDPVDIGIAMDFNYYVDQNVAGPHPNVVPRTEEYTGTLIGVASGHTTYTLTLTPKISDAVVATVDGWNVQTYPVTVTGEHVTWTEWTA